LYSIRDIKTPNPASVSRKSKPEAIPLFFKLLIVVEIIKIAKRIITISIDI
jgi:hypothetical protein